MTCILAREKFLISGNDDLNQKNNFQCYVSIINNNKNLVSLATLSKNYLTVFFSDKFPD